MDSQLVALQGERNKAAAQLSSQLDTVAAALRTEVQTAAAAVTAQVCELSWVCKG
jgi:hypothetical protein